MLDALNHKGRVVVKCVIIYNVYKKTLLPQKDVRKYLTFNVEPLTVTQKKFITFRDAKSVMILVRLERLKQSSTFGLIIIKVNTNLFREGKQNIPQKHFHSHYVQDCLKVLTIGMSLYLRSVKRTNNLKKEKRFGNTN